MPRISRLGLLICLGASTIAFGCREEFQNDGSSSGSETDTGSDTGSDSGSDSGTDTGADPDELLFNGSFEMWAGGAPVGWLTSGPVSLLEVTEGTQVGESAVQLSASEYGSLNQNLELAEPIPAGTLLEFEILYRWDSGFFEGPGVDVVLTYVGGAEEMSSPSNLPSPGDGWVQGGGGFLLADDLESISVRLVLGGFGEQVVEIDFVSLVRT